MTFAQRRDAAHLWMLALLDCAAERRPMCHLPSAPTFTVVRL